VGVPQGDPISPILFNLFISDLPSSLNHIGVSLNGISIPYIQYADNLCILGETPEDLQLGLTCLKKYCATNFIDINTTKTKVQVFHRGRLPVCDFALDGAPIEQVSEFCYLGFTFSVQLSFSQHAKIINSKARAKCGLLYSQLPLQHLTIELVQELFDVFILPIYRYGLPLWISNCSNSSLQSINATYTKFLKRYLQVPTHSNNSSVHFLTSSIPLSSKLKIIAPTTTGGLSFPEMLHGTKLSFLTDSLEPPPHHPIPAFQDIPSSLWLSKTFKSIPTNPKSRKRLAREILDSDHQDICQTKTFHPSSSLSCICIACGEHAHTYHRRFCNEL